MKTGRRTRRFAASLGIKSRFGTRIQTVVYGHDAKVMQNAPHLKGWSVQLPEPQFSRSQPLVIFRYSLEVK